MFVMFLILSTKSNGSKNQNFYDSLEEASQMAETILNEDTDATLNIYSLEEIPFEVETKLFVRLGETPVVASQPAEVVEEPAVEEPDEDSLEEIVEEPPSVEPDEEDDLDDLFDDLETEENEPETLNEDSENEEENKPSVETNEDDLDSMFDDLDLDLEELEDM